MGCSGPATSRAKVSPTVGIGMRLFPSRDGLGKGSVKRDTPGSEPRTMVRSEAPIVRHRSRKTQQVRVPRDACPFTRSLE